MRETSIEAYHKALASGWISQCEHTLIEVAHENWRDAGHTTRELMRLVARKVQTASWEDLQDYQKAIHGLKMRGVFLEMDRRPCECSGNKAHPVKLTYQYPREREKPFREEVHGDASLLNRFEGLVREFNELKERMVALESAMPRQTEMFTGRRYG